MLWEDARGSQRRLHRSRARCRTRGHRPLRPALVVLGDVASELARSALAHAHCYRPLPRTGRLPERDRLSQFRIVSVTLLAQEVLDNPSVAAESIVTNRCTRTSTISGTRVPSSPVTSA